MGETELYILFAGFLAATAALVWCGMRVLTDLHKRRMEQRRRNRRRYQKPTAEVQQDGRKA